MTVRDIQGLDRRARVVVFASGSGTNLQALLDACAAPDAPAAVVAAVSDAPTAPALDRARRAGVAAEVLADPRDGTAVEATIAGHDPDLIVLAGYLKLVPLQVVDRYAGRILNIHPALLPAFGGKGMYGLEVHRAVLASRATVTGPTIHLVDHEYDNGGIVAQWPVPVRADDSPESLAARVQAVEHRLLPHVVFAAARALARGHTVESIRLEAPTFATGDDIELDFASAEHT